MQTAPSAVESPQTLNIWKDEVTGSETKYPAGVDKRENLSRSEFLHEYVLKNRCVILKDAARATGRLFASGLLLFSKRSTGPLKFQCWSVSAR